MGIHLLADHDVVPEAAAPGALSPAKRGSRALPVATGIGLGAATYPCTSVGPSSGRAAAAGWPAPAGRTLFLRGSAHSGLPLAARRGGLEGGCGRVQSPDDGRIACRPALHHLAGTCAQVDDGLLLTQLDDAQRAARLLPLFQLVHAFHARRYARFGHSYASWWAKVKPSSSSSRPRATLPASQLLTTRRHTSWRAAIEANARVSSLKPARLYT